MCKGKNTAVEEHVDHVVLRRSLDDDIFAQDSGKSVSCCRANWSRMRAICSRNSSSDRASSWCPNWRSRKWNE